MQTATCPMPMPIIGAMVASMLKKLPSGSAQEAPRQPPKAGPWTGPLDIFGPSSVQLQFPGEESRARPKGVVPTKGVRAVVADVVRRAQQGQKVLFLPRGAAGAGKSTAVRMLGDALSFCGIPHKTATADQWFTNGSGYHFHPKGLRFAHAHSQRAAFQGMDSGFSVVSVDNTNLATADFRNYLLFAKHAGYQVVLFDVDTAWARDSKALVGRSKANGHSVPEAKIEAMTEKAAKPIDLERILKGLKGPPPEIPDEPPPVNPADARLFRTNPDAYAGRDRRRNRGGRHDGKAGARSDRTTTNAQAASGTSASGTSPWRGGRGDKQPARRGRGGASATALNRPDLQTPQPTRHAPQRTPQPTERGRGGAQPAARGRGWGQPAGHGGRGGRGGHQSSVARQSADSGATGGASPSLRPEANTFVPGGAWKPNA